MPILGLVSGFVSGCGNPVGDHQVATTHQAKSSSRAGGTPHIDLPALPGVAGSFTSSPDDRGRKPIPPGGPATTRLVAGPVIFRVTGAPAPTRTQSTPKILFAMIFRLNRAVRFRGAPEDLPDSVQTPSGNYYVITNEIGWGPDNSIFQFGTRSDKTCLVGYFDTENIPPQLTRVRIARRVRVVLQPTAPTAGGGLQLGKLVFGDKRSDRATSSTPSFVRYPRLQRANNDLRKSPKARHALQRIGCHAKFIG